MKIVVSVARQTLCLLDDGGRPSRTPVLGVLLDDPARPQHVVAQVQAPDPDPVPRRPPRVRVALLVDVVVDDVELAPDRVQTLDRVADVPQHPVPQPGARVTS